MTVLTNVNPLNNKAYFSQLSLQKPPVVVKVLVITEIATQNRHIAWLRNNSNLFSHVKTLIDGEKNDATFCEELEEHQQSKTLLYMYMYNDNGRLSMFQGR